MRCMGLGFPHVGAMLLSKRAHSFATKCETELALFDGRVFDQRGLCGAWGFRSALYFVVRGIVLDLCLWLVFVGLGLAGASVQ